MTDTRIPERYLMSRTVARLSAEDFRALVMATMWSVSNRTGGVIEHDDIAMIPLFPSSSELALVDAGLWEPTASGWLIVDFASTQTSKDELESSERVRTAARLKKAKQRAVKKAEGLLPGTVPPSVPGTVPPGQTGDVSRGTAQAGKAKAKAKAGRDLGTPPEKAKTTNDMQRDALAGWRAVDQLAAPIAGSAA